VKEVKREKEEERGKRDREGRQKERRGREIEIKLAGTAVKGINGIRVRRRNDQ
jgi:hypothetical protein